MFAVNVKGDDPLATALYDVLMKQSEFTLVITEPRVETVYEPGDRVQAAFDDGWGPAEIVSSGVYDGERRVTIKYGRGGKYRATVSADAIRTDRKIQHPARVEVL